MLEAPPQITAADPSNAAEFEAFVGPRKWPIYRYRFERLERGEADTFHLFAAIGGVFWLAYRGMPGRAWGWAGVSLLLWLPGNSVEHNGARELGKFLSSFAALGLFAWAGARGSSWYYRHACRHIAEVRELGWELPERLTELRRRGGTRRATVLVLMAVWCAVAAAGARGAR